MRPGRRSGSRHRRGGVFPGAACVVALVDRFAQHCHRITIDADSWRESHGLNAGDPPPARPPSRRRRRPAHAADSGRSSRYSTMNGA